MKMGREDCDEDEPENVPGRGSKRILCSGGFEPGRSGTEINLRFRVFTAFLGVLEANSTLVCKQYSVYQFCNRWECLNVKGGVHDTRSLSQGLTEDTKTWNE